MRAETKSGLVGCGIALAGAAVTLALVAFLIYNEAAKLRQQQMVAAMPPGWMTLLRQRATVPPAVRALEPQRGIAANGAFAVYDTAAGSWTMFAMDSVFARVSQDRREPQDAFTLREIVGDEALSRWLRWAEYARWEALALAIQHSEAAAERDLLRLRVPDYRNIRAALYALALRGWALAERGDRAGAERDLRAVVGLGAMLARHEPSMPGFRTGRNAVHAGALGLAHLAQLTRDERLAEVAAAAAAWSSPSTTSDWGILAAAPDSALVLAVDTTLSLGIRSDALRSVIEGRMVQPRAQLLGFPGRWQRRLDDLAARTTGEFGRLAALAAGAGRAVDDMGPRERKRLFGR